MINDQDTHSNNTGDALVKGDEGTDLEHLFDVNDEPSDLDLQNMEVENEISSDEEEAFESGKFDVLDAETMYFSQLKRIPLLSNEEAIEYARKAKKGSAYGRQKMIESNLRLVVSIAQKYHYSDMSLIDRVQEGNIGLMRAVDKFDPERGVKFSTYATWWIRQFIEREIINQGGTIRIPIHIKKQKNLINRARIELAEELNLKPNQVPVGDIVELLKKSDVGAHQILADAEKIDEVSKLVDAAAVINSLDEPRFDEDSSTLGDTVSSSEECEPEHQIEHNRENIKRQDLFINVMEELFPDTRDRDIFCRYYGFMGYEQQSSSKIAVYYAENIKDIKNDVSRIISCFREYLEDQELSLEYLRPTFYKPTRKPKSKLRMGKLLNAYNWADQDSYDLLGIKDPQDLENLRASEAFQLKEEFSFLQKITQSSILSGEDHDTYMSEALQGDDTSYNALIGGYLPLAASIAKRYQTEIVSFPELIQEGAFRLLRHFHFSSQSEDQIDFVRPLITSLKNHFEVVANKENNYFPKPHDYFKRHSWLIGEALKAVSERYNIPFDQVSAIDVVEWLQGSDFRQKSKLQNVQEISKILPYLQGENADFSLDSPVYRSDEEAEEVSDCFVLDGIGGNPLYQLEEAEEGDDLIYADLTRLDFNASAIQNVSVVKDLEGIIEAEVSYKKHWDILYRHFGLREYEPQSYKQIAAHCEDHFGHVIEVVYAF